MREKLAIVDSPKLDSLRMSTLLGLLALSAQSDPVSVNLSCDIAIVGAGPGGIFFAWRFLKAAETIGSVCILERSNRHGGRIYSLRNLGPRADLTVDVGAYRYAPQPYQEGSWYVYTPLLGGLIDTALGLPSAIYEPGKPVRKIVDAYGENAGYATFVDIMLSQIQSDAHMSQRLDLRFHEELISITPAAPHGGPVTLTFLTGLTVTATTVVLNLPQLPLLKVLERSETLFEGAVPPALLAPLPSEGAKLYVHYTNAWWRNILNLTSGAFGVPPFNSTGVQVGQLPDLAGRYHDGHTRCDGTTEGTRCRGFLEATYTYGDNARFFLTEMLHTDSPYTTLNYSRPLGKTALDGIHAKLVEYHRDALDRVQGYNATALVEALRPEFATLSYWGAQTAGYGGAVHNTRDGPFIRVEDEAPKALAPFGEQRIYVANEAYGALRGTDGVLGGHHGWAECSLVMAENVLVQKLGLKPPSWMNSSIYDEYVMFKYDASERKRRSGWHQG